MESLAGTSYHIESITRSLNDISLADRWRGFPFPHEVQIAAQTAITIAERSHALASEAFLESAKEIEGQFVVLDLVNDLRDRQYFIDNFKSTEKEYHLVPKPGQRPRRAIGGIDLGRTYPNLLAIAEGRGQPSYAGGYETVKAEYVPLYSQVGRRVGLLQFYERLVGQWDSEANRHQEEEGHQPTDQLNLPDYSNVRELLESKYPADQLLSLYMVKRAHEGDQGAALRVVVAYKKEWFKTARNCYNKWFKTDPGVSLFDIQSYAYQYSQAALMGNTIQIVRKTRDAEKPFSTEVVAGVLRPSILQERYSKNKVLLPPLVKLAIQVYLANWFYGATPDNVDPDALSGKSGYKIGAADFIHAEQACRWVLLCSLMTDVVTANDALVQRGRFEPREDGWKLDVFFRRRVKDILTQIYEKAEFSTTDLRFAPKGQRLSPASITQRLDAPIGKDSAVTLGETIADDSLPSEEAIARKMDLRTALSALWPRLNKTQQRIIDCCLKHDLDLGESQKIADLTGIKQSTVSMAVRGIKEKARKSGLRKMLG